MPTPITPREIFLLERFCSPEHFKELRDCWHAALVHAEAALRRFMTRPPSNYRDRPLSMQPDRVWGEIVLPNFRDTMDSLNRGYEALLQGDLLSLGCANGVEGDLRGQRMDYPEDWMDEVEPGMADRYDLLGSLAGKVAKPIRITFEGHWSEGGLTTRYEDIVGEPLKPPPAWPSYRTDTTVRVRTGERIPRTGIYLPDLPHGFPTLLVAAHDRLAKPAFISKPANSGDSRPWAYAACTWTLVERTSDVAGNPFLIADSKPPPTRLRCEANHPCPRTGYWFTPARLDSRRHFAIGETMPHVSSRYDAIIWQWDDLQTP